MVTATVELKDRFDLLLKKYELHKTLKVWAWVRRFIIICYKFKKSGPFKTLEIEI